MTVDDDIWLECNDRIYAFADTLDKLCNVMGYAVVLINKKADSIALTPEEQASLAMCLTFQTWIAQMRSTAAALTAAPPADPSLDQHWPPPPAGLDAFLALF